MMRRRTPWMIISVAVPAVLVATACSSGGGNSSTTSSGSKIDTTPFTLAWNSPPDVTNLPEVVAVKRMQQAGYKMSTTVVASQPVDVQAVISGKAQMGIDPLVTVGTAVSQGQPLVVFGKDRNDSFELVAKSSIHSLAQLNGGTVALASSTGSLTAAEVTWTQVIHNLHFHIVLASSSSARAAALLAGRVDATPLELDDVYAIQQKAPGKFRVLVTYNQLLPWLESGVLFTTKSFYTAHKSIFQAYMNYYAQANKEAVANPTAFAAKYSTLVQGYTPSQLEASLKRAVSQGVFEGNGQLVTSAENRSLKFFETAKQMTGAQVSKLVSTESSWLQPITSAP